VRWLLFLHLVVTTLLLAAAAAASTAADDLAVSSVPTTFGFALIAITYGITLASAVALRRGGSATSVAAVQLGYDVLATTVLVHVDGGADAGFELLYLLVVIAGAMTLPRRGSRAIVAAAAIAYTATAMGDRLGLLPVWTGVELPPPAPLRAVVFAVLKNLVFIAATAALSRRLADELERAGERIADQGARLEELAALHADVVRSLTSGLLTVDTAGVVLSTNPFGEEILGRPVPAGRRLAESLPDVAAFLAAIPLDGSRRRGELTLPREGGEPRVLGLSVSPLLNAAGQAVGRLVNFQDLSELRRMQDRIERTERLAAIGRLAAGVAHEIRNPLAAISGSVELLRPSLQLDGEGRELMDIVTREAERLNRLITDLLDFARPRTPEKSALDVGLTLGEILRVVENDRRLNPTANRFHLAIAESLHVAADPGQLRQVVLNLLLNAADATPGGEPIELSAIAEGDVVRIEVRDHGPGIPPSVRPRIFEPFFTTKKGGTGLGLATVHRIIEEHHGSIEAADAPGGGTVFTVRLPRARAAGAEAA
jgi:two-component system sensor histidine kinase PilS (NtrC family)